MLYAIPCAVLAAAWAAACRRCWNLRRALIAERAAARLDQALWARDVDALERAARAGAVRTVREEDVLAQAAAVVDAAYAAATADSTGSDIPKGGTDG